MAAAVVVTVAGKDKEYPAVVCGHVARYIALDMPPTSTPPSTSKRAPLTERTCYRPALCPLQRGQEHHGEAPRHDGARALRGMVRPHPPHLPTAARMTRGGGAQDRPLGPGELGAARLAGQKLDGLGAHLRVRGLAIRRHPAGASCLRGHRANSCTMLSRLGRVCRSSSSRYRPRPGGI